jgi:hypothetical protein
MEEMVTLFLPFSISVSYLCQNNSFDGKDELQTYNGFDGSYDAAVV